LSAAGEYPEDPKNIGRPRREIELEQILDDLTGDRPENQTAVDMPPEKCREICADIKVLTEAPDFENRYAGSLYRERKVPSDILASHGITNWDIDVVSRYFSEGSAEIHRINSYQVVSGNIFEGKSVSFTKRDDDFSIEESAAIQTADGTFSARPFTLSQLGQIHQALRDMLQEGR
jgi:hypothetical protein